MDATVKSYRVSAGIAILLFHHCPPLQGSDNGDATGVGSRSQPPVVDLCAPGFARHHACGINSDSSRAALSASAASAPVCKPRSGLEAVCEEIMVARSHYSTCTNTISSEAHYNHESSTIQRRTLRLYPGDQRIQFIASPTTTGHHQRYSERNSLGTFRPLVAAPRGASVKTLNSSIVSPLGCWIR